MGKKGELYKFCSFFLLFPLFLGIIGYQRACGSGSQEKRPLKFLSLALAFLFFIPIRLSIFLFGYFYLTPVSGKAKYRTTDGGYRLPGRLVRC